MKIITHIQHITKKQKTLILALAAVLIVIAGGTFFYASSQKPKPTPRKPAVSKLFKNISVKPLNTTSTVCQDLDVKAATKLLGASAEKSAISLPDQKTNAAAVSSCMYRTKTKTGQASRALSVLLRSNTSQDVIKQSFTTASKATGMSSVAGYGDEAFRNAAGTQLSIRKGSNWIMVMVSVAAKGQRPAADIAKDAAKVILSKI